MRPIIPILVFAAALRIISAVYSEGYLMHDDHFWVVESSASWADDYDYNKWLPSTQEALGRELKPHHTNLFYSSLHYLYFEAMNFIGLESPMNKMLVLRLIHGALSLIAVYLSYLIAGRLGGKKPAIIASLMMASLAWIPIISVHQLVESTAIIPLLAFAWRLVKNEVLSFKPLVIAGLWLGIATGLRYQIGIMGLGLIIAFLINSNYNLKESFKQSVTVGVSAIFFFAMTQIPMDLLLWGKPFAQLSAYIEYNLTSHAGYPQGTYLTYLFTILLLTGPPISILFMWGYLKSYKKYAVIVWPSLAFILFHTLFPNRQERFILPAIPFVIIAGALYYTHLKKNNFFKFSFVLSVVINSILLLPLTIFSVNTSQMRAMDYLRQQNDLENVLYVSNNNQAYPPRFYSGEWLEFTYAKDTLEIELQRKAHCKDTNTVVPNYILFAGDTHTLGLAYAFKDKYKSMSYEARIKGSRFDRALNWIAPHIPIKEVTIYKIDPNLECSEFLDETHIPNEK